MINKKSFFILIVLVMLLNLAVICANNTENTISKEKIQDNAPQISENNYEKDYTKTISKETKLNKENKTYTNTEINKREQNTLKTAPGEENVNSYTGLVTAANNAKTSTQQNYTINLQSGNYDATEVIRWNSTGNCKTLIINGNNNTLNGKGTIQFMQINSGTTVILNNLHLNNYYKNGNGGVIVNQGTLIIRNSSLTNSIATMGGGAIYNYQNSIVYITNTNFTNNKANEGGAIYGRLQSNIIVQNSNFTYNTATDGGAIQANNNTNVNIANSSFTNNTATYGGAIQANNSTILNIANSSFTNNTATDGGAIGGYRGTSINVTNSTLLDNSARYGGGVFGQLNINLTVTSSNFTNNNVPFTGGAIHIQTESHLNGINNNFKNNTAGYGGALYVYDRTNMTVRDTNFTDNTAGYGAAVYVSDNSHYINITNTNFINNNATYGGGAVYNRYGYVTLIKSNLTSNTPPTWEITNNSQVYNIKLLNADGYVPDNGIVTVYINNKFKGNYILTNGMIENIVIPTGGTIKLVVNGSNMEEYCENTYTFRLNITMNITMNITNTTVNQGDRAIIFIKFNDTVNYGSIQISNQTNILKNINILEETDFIVADIDTTYLPYSDNILNITYLIDNINITTSRANIKIRIPTIITTIIENQTTLNTSLRAYVNAVETETTVTGLISIHNADGKIIGSGYLENGISIINIKSIPKGTQEITIKYNGDDYCQENRTTLTLNIKNQAMTNITILNNTEGNISIKVNITTDDQKAYENKDVEIILPNGTSITTTTDTNGIIQITDTTTTQDTSITIKVADTSEVKGINTTIEFQVVPDYQKIIDGMNDTIKQQNTTINKLNNTINELEKQIENANQKITEQNKTINELNKKLDDANRNINKLNKELEDATKKINNLTNTINDLNNKNKQLEEIIKELNKTTPKLNTTITIKPVKATIGEITTITANIKDTNNKAVTGGRVIFKVNGKTLKDETGNTLYAEVKDGTASINYKVQSVWMKNTTYIEAVYSETEKYNTTRTKQTGILNISKGKAKITLDKKTITAKAGQTITLRAKIIDANGNRINNDKVVFKINGKTLKDKNGNTLYAKVKDGEAVLEYTIPSTYSAKTYTLTAVFGGNYYQRTETNGSIKLEKKAVLITPDSITTKNKKTTIKATITDETGKLLVTSTKLAFKVNGKTILNNVTSKNGKIDLSFTTTLRPGLYELLIISGENSLYKTGKVTTVLKI
ncbi:hypothetical protein PXD04_11105 (plasmid) [Methanosphaera sp. ISO3-F5]|uniref:hypothetical protein n=1 Tax=Methanosphaera sp. ISO3-F5 TaxID=1452353 RepID=UPI002B260B80|nr:hypothetical protein [Methanosphaera sp. ISO3-F5]WQH65422.1 hypothetical protein PXD04_11105 [Methanosphaera sp. ISO3-F5]